MESAFYCAPLYNSSAADGKWTFYLYNPSLRDALLVSNLKTSTEVLPVARRRDQAGKAVSF